MDVALFKNRRKEAVNGLTAWHRDVRRDFDFYSGNQWDSDSAAKLAKELRPALVFNRILPIINSASGAEITNRFEPKFFPRNPELADVDTGVSEVLSEIYRWIRQKSDAEHEESLAFRDCLISGVGITNTYQEYEINPDGRTVTKRVPVHEVVWDPSAQEQGYADSRYIIRARWVPEQDFKERWPDAWGEVRGISTQRSGMWGTSFGRPSSQRDAWKYEGEATYDAVGKRVLVYEYQWYDRVQEYRVFLPDGATTWVPQSYFEGFRDQYNEMFQGQPLDAVLLPRRRYQRAFLAGDIEIETSDNEVEDFTYKFMTALEERKSEEQICHFGLVRPMRDPQMWSNKFLSQAVHIFASNPKGAVLFETGTFPDIQRAMNEWARPEGMIEVRPGALAQKSYEVVKPPGMPSGLEFLLQFAVSAIPATSGVNEAYFVGRSEDLRRVATSAVQSVQQQTLAVLAPFFDALRRYRKNQAELVLKFIRNYMPEGQQIRVVGDQGAQYVSVSQDILTAEYDIVIDEAPTSPNSQEEFARNLIQTNLLPQLLEMGVPIPPDIIDYFGKLPRSLREKMKQMIALQQQAAAQQGAVAAQPGGPNGQ